MPAFDLPLDSGAASSGANYFGPTSLAGAQGDPYAALVGEDYFPGERLPGDPETYPKGTGITGHTGGGHGGSGVGPGGGFAGYAGVGGGMPYGGNPGAYGTTPLVGRRFGFAAGGPVDNVPAMLSNGEFVVNAGAASHPAIRELLDIINEAGKRRMAHMACGGPVRHYAEGGPVAPMMDLATFISTYAPGLERAPLGKQLANKLYQQYVDKYRAANPDTSPGSIGGANDILNQYGQQGYFSPEGSRAMLDAVNEGAQRDASGLQRQASLAADVYGMDPAQAASARFNAVRDTQRNAADILSSARLGQMQNQQAFGQNLFGNVLGYNQGVNTADLNYQHQRLLNNQQADQAKHATYRGWLNPSNYVGAATNYGGGSGMSTSTNPSDYGGWSNPEVNRR